MSRQESHIYAKFAVCIFEHLSDSIEKEFKLCDMDHTMVLQLSEFDARGLSFLQQHAIEFLSLTIDSSALEKVLKKWWVKREEYELEDQFLLQHASQAMMRELFGMHSNTFSWRRKLLGMEGEGRHRPALFKSS